MTSPTKQFIWKDRDTAARDLLHLAYYAPPTIARLALKLLQAIRSPIIIPELVALVNDEQRDMWQRVYALRAIVSIPGDWYLPHLQEEMRHILHRRVAIIASHPHPERAYLGHDLLEDIRDLAAYHPANRPWFFSALDSAPGPDVVCGFLTSAINYAQSEEFRQQLIEYLLNLLTSHPEQLDTSVIQTLAHEETPNVSEWLQQRTASIVEILASNVTDFAMFSVAENWADVRKGLAHIVPHFEDRFDAYLVDRNERHQERHAHNLSDYHESSAYKRFFALYQRAETGDEQAYWQLVRVARRHRNSIPLRALATHMIGQLRHRYKVTGVLCGLLKYAHDDWGNESAPLTPVRAEAGEALKDIPTPDVWTNMIDAFFISPRNVLSDAMLDWIAHVTDVLDGVSTVYVGPFWGTEAPRRWFRALAEISDEQLQRELGSS